MKTLGRVLAVATVMMAAHPAYAVTFSTGPLNSGPQAPSGFEVIKLFADFNSGAPAGLTGGKLHNGSNGTLYAEPANDPTQYYAVGPEAGTPASISISDFDKVSLYWGSIDYYNTISFTGVGGTVLQSFTGAQIVGGMPTGAESRTVTFLLNSVEAAAVRGISFSSSINAFEFDNLTIGSAPEPATWATMMIGFGVVGGLLRRRSRRTSVPVQTA